MSATIGLYAHVPFCARRCDYCDFFVVAGSLREETAAGYFDLLERELAHAVGEAGEHVSADTVYLGGGTPSFVPPDSIGRFIHGARLRVSIPPWAEITLEANPESVAARAAAAWRSAGVNRLSLGAQSFDDAVLAPRGRLHTARGTRDAFRTARSAGFDNIGIDLIAGLPGETAEGFADGLDAVVELAPEHVSVYLLETAESGKDSPLARAVSQGRAHPAGESDLVAMYESAVERLTRAGYLHYEISNFARQGHASRHNLKYWRSEPWIGLGPSAHSHIGGRRLSNPSDMEAWMRAVEKGTAWEEYTFPDPGRRAREALVMELRLTAGVETAAFARRWGLDPAVDLAQTLGEMEEAGLLRLRDGCLALTPRGVLLSNEVFGRIL